MVIFILLLYRLLASSGIVSSVVSLTGEWWQLSLCHIAYGRPVVFIFLRYRFQESGRLLSLVCLQASAGIDLSWVSLTGECWYFLLSHRLQASGDTYGSWVSLTGEWWYLFFGIFYRRVGVLIVLW
jgi:hypothetical protein